MTMSGRKEQNLFFCPECGHDIAFWMLFHNDVFVAWLYSDGYYAYLTNDKNKMLSSGFGIRYSSKLEYYTFLQIREDKLNLDAVNCIACRKWNGEGGRGYPNSDKVHYFKPGSNTFDNVMSYARSLVI